MKKIQVLIKKYRELLTYILFGLLTTLVNFVFFDLWYAVLGAELYLVANILAWAAAVVFAYFTNKAFVFRDHDWNSRTLTKQFLEFAAARAFSLVVEEVGLYVLMEHLGFQHFTLHFFTASVSGKMCAKMLLAAIVVILNYVFSKLCIFKKSDK